MFTIACVGGSSAFAIVWVFISCILGLALASAEDNPNMSAAVPWSLKTACSVVFFPMRYLQNWDQLHASFSDGTMFHVFLGMFVNGIFWGFVFASLFWFLMRFLPIRRHSEIKKNYEK